MWKIWCSTLCNLWISLLSTRLQWTGKGRPMDVQYGTWTDGPKKDVLKTSLGRAMPIGLLQKCSLKLPNFHMLLNQKNVSLPGKFTLQTFGEFLTVFSTKVNLLHFLYSMALRCCLMHLIKQNCSLKTFLITLILMTQVSLYLFSLLELIWNCMLP